MTDAPLDTVDAVVDALGGTAATSRLFDVSMSAVSNWRRDRLLPERLHHRIFRECEARGLAVAPALLGERAA